MITAVLVIDKPLGLTSFDVVARVRRLLSERRVGHAGTLDPLASGVLIVCVGAATKLVPSLMDTDKVYRATVQLGVTTDTDDADPRAQILFRADEKALSALHPEAIAAKLLTMVGDIVQRPPRFSALKHQGRRLYAHARAQRQSDAGGAPVDVDVDALLDAKQRTVRVHSIDIESIALDEGPPRVTFTVCCGKGTYIRSMARDLGEALGVGGHLSALRRLRVGPFDESLAVSLDTLVEQQSRFFTPVEALARLKNCSSATAVIPP